ncbi:MAG: hypothetical protein QOH89_1711 [Pseudonocardiales bacterium]|jgi:hypothetical protein|nr:hypothetical protein [Pseudonocardiales bacterium]MDT4940108.1 hypothetical protein [Pseudonocardiales bacterium]
MGRGRAKAKQQKVARELKYNTQHLTDLEALQRELGRTGSAGVEGAGDDPDAAEDEHEDWTGTDR